VVPSNKQGIDVSSSILVLKDGRIIEQGSHGELLAQDGVFATMWADQISASGDTAASVEDQAVKEAVAGDPADQAEPAADAAVEDDAQRERAASSLFVDKSEATPAAPESTADTGDMPPVPSKEPEAVPADESVPPAALAFPTAEDTTRPTSERIPSQSGGGVTFEDSVNAPPSRSGTPDPEAEPKRKRISSQNLQRIARKISLTTRRQGSGTVIPGIKRDSPSTPQDGTSARNSNESPTASVQSDTGKKKKDKKEKRKSIF
jgi:hypothetical protein